MSKTKIKYRLQFYRDAAGEYRWRIKRSGRIIAESGEGYKRELSAKRAIKNFIASNIAGEPILVEDISKLK